MESSKEALSQLSNNPLAGDLGNEDVLEGLGDAATGIRRKSSQTLQELDLDTMFGDSMDA